MDRSDVVSRVCEWYAHHARDLPWRRADATPWGVMVSEFMLQQTPVSRVLGPWAVWLERWPTPAALAAEPSGEAVRAWGRLGYPRRALRLHQAATAIVAEHGGAVPRELDDLRALPGVGEYTAAAIASFAFGGDHVVLDTNVRRVLGRIERGEELPAASVTRTERDRARAWSDEAASPATWAVAAMELGALVCTAAAPRCDACPVAGDCAWRAAGWPQGDPARRRGQDYEGTDRQCRGRLLARLRDATRPLSVDELTAVWPDRERAATLLADLVSEGLVRREADGYRL